ncbi:MAG: SDR family NAD(P)-dependent oxidoreductase [Oscillospiraceae bacterium]|nr:SDR family NAD(P)-dependent oxidoreductase [Oscillospiraceae bacterium]
MIDGKTIVLTGASSGIGLEVLKLLAQGKDNRILAVARHVDNIQHLADNVTAFSCDISTQEGVDRVFAKAEELFGKIDLFYANAGFPYYEEFNYADWDRVDAMFRTNTISPIYTYAKYIRHLDGRPGILAYTVSAIGEMAMPGYAIYSSSKFALNGFQQAIRLEAPENLQITCLYPVATDTNFFKVANAVEFEKPFPVQKPAHVAKMMVKAIEQGKERVCPSGLFGFAKVLMGVAPPVRTFYWKLETKKLDRFKEKLATYHGRIHEKVDAAVEKGREVGETILEKEREARRDLAEKVDAAVEKGREVGGTILEKEREVRRDLGEKATKAAEEIKDKIHGA